MTLTHRTTCPVYAYGIGYPAGTLVKLVGTDRDGMSLVNVSFYVPDAYPQLIRVRPSCLEPIPPREEQPK
jgi:hypothetical protein